jgi:hypothetical protein
MKIRLNGEEWETQVSKRLWWHVKHPLMSPREFNDGNPAPIWAIPLDGWITDPKEIKRAIMLDDLMGFKRDEK